MLNESLLNSLDSRQKVEAGNANAPNRMFAQLLDMSGNQVFNFLLNPESLKWSRKANYKEAATAASSLPAQQYINTSGRTLEIPDLLLPGFYYRRSLNSIIDSIQTLMVADTKKGLYRPKLVYFSWGSYKFGPAVVKEVSWEETAWLGGDPAEATMSITLIETTLPDDNPYDTDLPPLGDPPGAAAASTTDGGNSSTNSSDSDSANKPPLSRWQRIAGQDNARSFIQKNHQALREDRGNPLAAYKADNYRVDIANNGAVTMKSKDGNTIYGLVGVWDGITFDTSVQQIFYPERLRVTTTTGGQR